MESTYHVNVVMRVCKGVLCWCPPMRNSCDRCCYNQQHFICAAVIMLSRRVSGQMLSTDGGEQTLALGQTIRCDRGGENRERLAQDGGEQSIRSDVGSGSGLSTFDRFKNTQSHTLSVAVFATSQVRLGKAPSRLLALTSRHLPIQGEEGKKWRDKSSTSIGNKE